MKSIFATVAVSLGLCFMASCSDDDFDPTIFDTDPSQDYLDRSLATFPLDTFIKKTYLEPYNVRFVYRLEDKSSDMTKNLTPARYDKSVDLAVLTSYLWYDVYKKLAGDEFLKLYSPRIISLAGSKNYNTTSGTEVLGDASSGVKINFYNVNNLDVSDINMMNEYFFKTMHHEFGHILDQTYLHPTTFNTLSQGHYDASGWQDRPDSTSAGSGFVSSYASSSYSEDWAETLANYVTRDTVSWQNLLNTASYDWETYELTSSSNYTDSLSNFNNANPRTRVEVDSNGVRHTITYFASAKDSIYYNLRTHGVTQADVVGYLQSTSSGKYYIYRKQIARDANGLPIPTENWGVTFTNVSGIDGRSLILQKLEIVRTYLREHYNISIDQLRKEVQGRAYVVNEDGTFAKDHFGRVVNKLTQVQPSGQTLIDELRQQVYQYDSLIQK